jgi:putative acetyltransferase
MVRIRRATAGDAEELCTLHKASIRQLCSAAYSAEQIAAWTQQLTPDRYLPAMRQLELLVAEEDRILGFSILDLRSAELRAVYLHPDGAGHGIGRRLVERAESAARRESLPQLRLEATLNAVGFYEACGFHRVRDAVHTTPSGVDLPCVAMAKTLEPVGSSIRGHREALGHDLPAYENHVVRVLRFVAALGGELSEPLVVAAAFHDLGIWTARTFDYLEPSVELAEPT